MIPVLNPCRSAERPHILVRPELRYCPPMIPPPHGWSASKTSSISQLVPVADVYSLRRQPSFSPSGDFVVRGPRKSLPPLPRIQPPLKRRRSNDIKIPGAYVEDRTRSIQEEILDEHIRKIEVEYVTHYRANSKQHPNTFGQRPRRNLGRLSSPSMRGNSNATYEKRSPAVERPFTSPVARIGSGTAHPQDDSVVGPETDQEVSWLSFGDLTFGLGKMFD